MRIPLRPGWEKHKFNTEIYPVSARDRDCIDEVFNRLHNDGKMDWATKSTPFRAPVFVTWKTSIDDKGELKHKGRPVIDMRETNDWVIKDSYPLTD